MRRSLPMLIAAVLPFAIIGCGSSNIMHTMPDVADSSRAIVQSQVPQSDHVVIVMEENKDYSSVVGDTSAWPNLNNLIRKGALPTHYYADSHPSIGNYFMLTTGETLTTNDYSSKIWDVDNIARHLLDSGRSFKIYAEGISRGYIGGDTGLYVRQHNPFALLSDIADSRSVAYDHLYPFTQFATDVADGNLPEFTFIIPDIDDDAHSGSSQQADYWLQTKVVDPLSNRPAFKAGGNGLLIVDFDEAADSDTRYGGGRVASVFWGPNVKVDFRQTSTTVYQHQSMLRTVMEALRLSNPPGKASSAPSMTQFFK